MKHLKEVHDILDFVGTIWGSALAFDKLTVEKTIPPSPIPGSPEAEWDSFLVAAADRTIEAANAFNSGNTAWSRLNEHLQLQCQMLHSRVVDNFLAYISELIAEVYKKQPNLLRTQETVTTEFALQFESMEEFVAALAEKRIHDLAYKGMREVAKTLSKSWGIELFPDERELSKVVYTVEVRNIIVHNRAIINRVFLSRVAALNFPDYLPQEKGTRYVFDIRGIMNTMLFMLSCAADIDKRVARKFALTTQVAPAPRETIKFPIEDLIRTEGEQAT